MRLSSCFSGRSVHQLRLALATVGAILILLPLWAEGQFTFDNVAYTIPEGWSEIPADGTYVQLEPIQLTAPEALALFLFPTASASISQTEALSQTWDLILSALGAQAELNAGSRYEASQPLPTSDGRMLLHGEGQCRATDGTLFDLRVYLLRDGDLYLTVFALANVLPNSIAYPPTSAIHNPRFAYQMPDFVLRLSTGTQHEPLPKPAMSLSGLWRGLSMFGGAFKNSFAYFFPDGRVYFASRMPMNGFDALPVDADAVITPGYWGRYSFDGQQGELQLFYQGNSTFPFTAGPLNNLTIVTTGTPHEFSPQPSVDGSVFDGTYALHLLSGETVTLTLSSSGQFKDQGVLKYVDHWIYPFRVSDEPGQGTYSVTNFTMVFRYSDGRVLRLPFSGLGITQGDSAPAALALGTEDDFLTLASSVAPRLKVFLETMTPPRLRLRWPASATGYILQSTDSLAPRDWVVAPQTPFVDGTENQLLIDLDGNGRFFRLVKP